MASPTGGRLVGVVPVPSHRVAALPDGAGFADAAALPVAGLTALRALREAGPLIGRRLLVTGATGGVGRSPCSSAWPPARTSRRWSAAPSAPMRPARWARTRRSHSRTGSGDARFHAALDGVGGPALAAAIHALLPRGAVIAYGVAGGASRRRWRFYDFAGAGSSGVWSGSSSIRPARRRSARTWPRWPAWSRTGGCASTAS